MRVLKTYEFNIYTTILPVLMSIFTLQYIGWTFDNSSDIPKEDWKRKWVIFFAWLGLVFSIISLLLVFWVLIIRYDKFSILMNSNKLLLFVGLTMIILCLLNSIFTLQYIGWIFDDKYDISKENWKRKWIIFFAWFTLVLSTCRFSMTKSETSIDTKKSATYI